MRPLTEIIVHCTATEPLWWNGKTTQQKVDEIRRWHKTQNLWKDIGYHYLIDRDGTIATGRPLDQVGAHVKGHNTGTIGISLFGGAGSNEKDKFGQHFTPQQDEALRKLIADLRSRFPAIMRVTGHNQYAAKACPGFYVPDWYAQKPSPKPDAEPAKPKAAWLAAIIAAIAAMFRRK